jgi:hypothetical protein
VNSREAAQVVASRAVLSSTELVSYRLSSCFSHHILLKADTDVFLSGQYQYTGLYSFNGNNHNHEDLKIYVGGGDCCLIRK